MTLDECRGIARKLLTEAPQARGTPDPEGWARTLYVKIKHGQAPEEAARWCREEMARIAAEYPLEATPCQ